jgi:hypothetical protein
MLVQQVLIQEHALREAEARIRDLEDQVREAGQSQGGGSFLGGLFGGRSAPAESRPGSVPSVGSGRPAAPPPPRYDAPPQADPWRQAGPTGAPAPTASSGGGFLRSAATTAAGVAGGVLLGDAIRGMFGGHAASAGVPGMGGLGGLGGTSADQRAADAYQDGQQDAEQAQEDEDAAQDAAQDAEQDDAGDWGGSDDSTDV